MITPPATAAEHFATPSLRSPGRSKYTRLERGGQNALAVTLGLLGDAWTLEIVYHALWGVTRYTQWMTQDRMSNSVLAPRLTRLTEMGVFARVAYQHLPTRHDYLLTERGRDIWPILLAMWSWEREWTVDAARPLPPIRHATCGRWLTPILVCSACEQPAVLREVAAREGPSGARARSVPAGSTRRRSVAQGSPANVLPHTMALIGNRWSAALLGASMLGVNRYGEFVSALSAPPAIVSERLRTFCEQGVLEQVPDEARPSRAGYHLTDKGRAFFPVVSCMIEWGQHWFRSPEGAAMRYRHKTCRRAFHPHFVCGYCHERVHRRDVDLSTHARSADR